MIRTSAAIAAVLVAATTASAQTSPPTYQADPSVYKVIFEDQNFRVIGRDLSSRAGSDNSGRPK